MDSYNRAIGCYNGMMAADALSYPSMMRGRHTTLPWIDRVMHKIDAHGREHNNTKPVIPFVWHRSEALKPTPTYVSEFALFTAKMIVDLDGIPSIENISGYWKEHIVAREQDVRSGVSERAAIVNYKAGYEPPVTGNDNPHTYDDGFVPRAISIALHAYEHLEKMEQWLQLDGSVTHADEGLAAGRAMAYAIAAGMKGASPQEMIDAGMSTLKLESWVGSQCTKAIDIAKKYDVAFAAIPELDNEVTSRIYNYGNIAAETLAVSFGLFLLADGNLEVAVPLAMSFPRLSDSVPAFVGALCGVYKGVHALPNTYDRYLNPPQGICVPSVKDTDIEQLVRSLLSVSTNVGGGEAYE